MTGYFFFLIAFLPFLNFILLNADFAPELDSAMDYRTELGSFGMADFFKFERGYSSLSSVFKLDRNLFTHGDC